MSNTFHLIDQIRALNSPRLIVLGDVILDRYQWGEAQRVSQEAPVLLLQQESVELRMGGAANVANMLRGLGADVLMAGVIGEDEEGVALRELLTHAGINCSALLTDFSRPTTLKERIMGSAPGRSSHQMLRIDRESRKPLNTIQTTKMLDRVVSQISQCDAILISDYGKGVCTPEIISRVIEIANLEQIPVLLDPALNVSLEPYQNITTITPNRLETQTITGVEIENIDDAFRAGQLLLEKTNCQNVFITLDKQGIVFIGADGQKEHFPTRMRSVCDITGAGDMVLAMVGVMAASGATSEDQIQLANIAGGLEVEQVGVCAISKQQILDDLLLHSAHENHKIDNWGSLAEKVRVLQANGKKVVFTNGCFDILHAGHVTYLQQAASLGDYLVVGVNSDSSIRQLDKGTGRPICHQKERAEVIASLGCVGAVTVFDQATPEQLIRKVKPNLLVKGGDYTSNQIIGREFVESYGGEVRVLSFVQGISTSEIINRILASQQTAIHPLPPTSVERKAG